MKFCSAILILLGSVLACSLPALGIPPDPNAPVPALLETGTPTPYSDPILPTASLPPPAPNLPSADLPFYIDCSALDPARQPDCDAYIAATRDHAYPLLRELTATSLSNCYEAVHYTIVPDAQLTDRQGQADENHITYALRASLDAAPAPLHDAHELLHTINFCNGALDQHVFHGAFESYVDLALTGAEWQSPGREKIANWLETNLIPGIQNTGDATPAPGAGAASSVDACTEVYGSLVTILYYDSGIETVKKLYRVTINPGPEYDPHPRLLALFGPAMGRQFQAVVNALKQNSKYPITVPECGMD